MVKSRRRHSAAHKFRIAMEVGQTILGGRERALGIVFCESLWRSVQYESFYLNRCDMVHQLRTDSHDYCDFHDHGRPHLRASNKKGSGVGSR